MRCRKKKREVSENSDAYASSWRSRTDRPCYSQPSTRRSNAKSGNQVELLLLTVSTGVQNFALEVRSVDFDGWFHDSISSGAEGAHVCGSNGRSAKASARTGFSPVASLTRTRPASETLAMLATTPIQPIQR